MKGMWVGYDVGCTMGLTCGHGAWQIDRQSSGSMWNSYSFQPVGQWMSYSFTDLGAEGCCRSLNALLSIPIPFYQFLLKNKFFFEKMFNFFHYMEIPCSSLTTRRENSIFHIRNRGSIVLIRIMFKWVEWSWPNNMATHGFNDGHHWLGYGLLHVWCHAIICHAMYLSIGVWETNQLHSRLGSIPFFQFNSNSVIFNSSSTTQNKFQFQFQFRRFH